MKRTPENTSRFFPLLLKSTIYEFDASSSQPHQKAAGNACRLLHLSFKGRRLRIQGFCFQPQQETAGNASGFCSLYPEGSGKRLRIFLLPSEDNRKLPRILFLLLEIFGVKGTFSKKSPCGARGADSDRAQWAKTEGGSPLSKGAPEAAANRGDYYEVWTRPGVPPTSPPSPTLFTLCFVDGIFHPF